MGNTAKTLQTAPERIEKFAQLSGKQIIVVASDNFGCSLTAYSNSLPKLFAQADSIEVALARLLLRPEFTKIVPFVAGSSEADLGAKLLKMAQEDSSSFRIQFDSIDLLA